MYAHTHIYIYICLALLHEIPNLMPKKTSNTVHSPEISAKFPENLQGPRIFPENLQGPMFFGPGTDLANGRPPSGAPAASSPPPSRTPGHAPDLADRG